MRTTVRYKAEMQRRQSPYRLGAAILVLTLPSFLAHGQANHAKPYSSRTVQQRPAAAGITHNCGNGVTLTLTVAAAPQGGLVEASVSSRGISDVKGEWAGKPLLFWADTKNVRHALLGIDLERPPGKYDLSVSAQLADGDSLPCSAAVDVRAGKFAVESLKVAPGFVELSPEDRARADKESARVHEIFARVTQEPLWVGRFRFPLAGSRSGHNFGKRRVLNGKASAPHTGLDIPAPAGTPIHASQRGRVVLAENLFFSGNTVILDHGLGVYTFYGHMKSMDVAGGDEVNAGAVLGEVGATGRATGPHLHWSLVVEGARVNPLEILRLQLP
jgi:murein DD-endopeptidase MepM/ murein hydrolase activator NlpD